MFLETGASLESSKVLQIFLTNEIAAILDMHSLIILYPTSRMDMA